MCVSKLVPQLFDTYADMEINVYLLQHAHYFIPNNIIFYSFKCRVFMRPFVLSQ